MAERAQHAQDNEEIFFVVGIVGLIVLVLAGWHFAGRYIYTYERMVLYGILSLWGSIPADWEILGFFTRKFLFFKHTHPSEISYVQDALYDSLGVNAVLGVVMLFAVLKVYLHVTGNHPFVLHARTHTIYSYMHEQMPLYPHVRLMWKLRLLARPMNSGLFRMGENAKEFSLRNGLVRLGSLAPDAEPVLDEVKSRRVFDGQLGRMLPLPTDDPIADAKAVISVLTNTEKAVVAAIICRLAACDGDVSDKDFKDAIAKSDELVRQYWTGFDSYKPALPTQAHHDKNPDMPLVPPPPPVNTSGCDEVLMRYLAQPIVRKSMLGHAYVLTFIYDAFQACRKVGKFPPHRFGWVRMLDRPFWLLLSSSGRGTPFWEAAGVHAHYLWERKDGCASEKPQTLEAVAALQFEFEELVVLNAKERAEIWAQQGGVPDAVALKGPPKKAKTP